MQLRYFLFCDHTSRSIEGKVNILGVFDKIFLNHAPSVEKPSIHPLMYLVFEVRGLPFPSKGKFSVKIQHSVSGQIMIDQSSDYEILEEKGVLTGMVGLQLFPIIAVGDYVASLAIDGQDVAKTFLTAALKA